MSQGKLQIHLQTLIALVLIAGFLLWIAIALWPYLVLDNTKSNEVLGITFDRMLLCVGTMFAYGLMIIVLIYSYYFLELLLEKRK